MAPTTSRGGTNKLITWGSYIRMKRPFFNRSLTTAESLHTRRCLLSKGTGFSFSAWLVSYAQTSCISKGRPHLNQSRSSLSLLSDASRNAILQQTREGAEVSEKALGQHRFRYGSPWQHSTDLSNGNMKHRFASSSVGAQSQRSRRALRSLHASNVDGRSFKEPMGASPTGHGLHGSAAATHLNRL